MAIPLTAIAGAFDQMSKQAQKFDQLEEQRKLLALELQRTAPEGYSVVGGPDGRPSLKYVGMADPRIQTQLAAEAQKLSMQRESQLALARQLEPIKMANAEAELRLRAELETQQKVYLAGLEAATEFAAASGQLANPAFVTLPPDKQALVAGDVAQKFAVAQQLDPQRAAAALAQLSPEARAFLGQGGVGQAAPAQGAPQGQAAPGGPVDVGRSLMPQPAAGAQPKPAQAAPAGAQAAPAPAGQPARPAAPPALEAVTQGIRTKIEAGMPVSDVRAEAVRILAAQASAQAGFGSLKGQALTEPEIMRIVDDTIADVQGADERAFQARRNRAMAAQLPLEEATAAQPEFEAGLTTTPEDRNAPYATFEIDEPTEEQAKAGITSETRVNENAQIEMLSGDSEPLARLRRQALSQGLADDTLAKLIGEPFAKPAAAELAKFQPRRTGAQGEVLILTPQKGSALAVDPLGTFRLTPGQDEKASRPKPQGRAAEALELGRQVGRLGGPDPEPSKVGLTPAGLAELVWASTFAPGVKPADRQVPRFVWINAPTRGLDEGKRKALLENNQAVFRAMGRTPKQGGGVWLDLSTFLSE